MIVSLMIAGFVGGIGQARHEQDRRVKVVFGLVWGGAVLVVGLLTTVVGVAVGEFAKVWWAAFMSREAAFVLGWGLIAAVAGMIGGTLGAIGDDQL